MINEKPLEFYCYQLKGILKNKQKNQKRTQNAVKYMNEAVSPLAYELESTNKGTKTEENNIPIKKGKAKNLCKCKLRKRNETNSPKNQTDTLSPIKGDGNSDLKNFYSRFTLFSNRKGSYQVNPNKKSFISFYPKLNKPILEHKDVETNTKKLKSKNIKKIKELKDIYIDSLKNKDDKKSKKSNRKLEKLNNKSDKSQKIENNSPIIKNEIKKKTDVDKNLYKNGKTTAVKLKSKKQKQKENTTNTCTEDICNARNKKHRRETDIKFLSKIGAGDQIIKVRKKCSNVISGFFKHSKLYLERQPPPAPMFAIKVDSSDMQVLNSAEIRRKVKAIGKPRKNDTCVCPSRLTKAKRYGMGDTCEAGICEAAINDKYFHCKCAKKVIECRDTTCDAPFTKPTKLGAVKNVQNKIIIPTSNNAPMFKMVLDKNHMNVLNTGEIEDVIKTASNPDIICPTGICNNSARKKGAILDCKCINKKISPDLHECDERTCRPKKSFLYIICSRIFSGSDKRSYYPNRRRAIVLGPNVGGHRHFNRNRQTVMRGGKMRPNLQYNNNDIDCMCYCECYKKPKKKKSKKKHVKSKKFSLFKQDSMKKKFHKSEKTYSKLQKKREREQRRKEREEERKQMQLKKEIDKLAMKEADNTNFLANLINGLLNLTMQTVRAFFRVIFSIIFDPINSYLYTKDKLTNPVYSLKTFKRWVVDTWKSKDSKFAKTIMDSDALHVLADHLEDSAIFQTFTNKGRTQVERHIYERKYKLRKRRMQKRHDEALYGCRHMLLTTLRKHPCLWVYHICPNYYPQCLSLLTFCGNFFHLLLYLGALLCWTPCIMVMEIVRAFICCVVCTQ